MSHKGNDSYLEELEMLEQDYKDDLEALENARKELYDAVGWEQKMIANANTSAKKLQDLKNRE